MKKLLIRLPNWVGDTIMALPALEGLCASASELVFSGTPAPLELTSHLLPEAPRFEINTSAGGSFLAERDFSRSHDVREALLLTPSFSSALRVWAMGIPQRYGWPEQHRSLFLNNWVKRGLRGDSHLITEFETLACSVGATWFPASPYLPPDSAVSSQAEAFYRRSFSSSDQPVVALCPGANYGLAKQWPLASYARLRLLLEKRGINGLIIGAANERELGEEILRGSHSGWFNATGIGSLKFSIELLRRASLSVCNDTGTMHLTYATGAPLLALFGSTNPDWTGPPQSRAQVMQRPVECAPCYRKSCPLAETAPCLAALTPDDVNHGVLNQLSSNPTKPHPALFIDRDGTLIDLIPYLSSAEQVKLIEGVGPAIRKARDAGYRIIVITNQSGVARGMFSERDVKAVHSKIIRLLADFGAVIDRFVYCPHHPAEGDRIRCGCRKPAPGMLYQAAAEDRIELQSSFMIGDSIPDLQAGINAGCHPILVKTGYGEKLLGENMTELPAGTSIVANLPSAIGQIISGVINQSRS